MPSRLRCAAGAARVPGRPVVMEEVSAEELDDEEQLLRRHRKEKKELQGDGRGPGAKGSVASVLVRPEGPPARSPGFSGFPPPRSGPHVRCSQAPPGRHAADPGPLPGSCCCVMRPETEVLDLLCPPSHSCRLLTLGLSDVV